MKKNRIVVIFFFLILFSCVSRAQSQVDGIIGNWLTTGSEPAKVQIYKSGGIFYGKIVWLKEPIYNGKPKLDINNPDKSMRSNPIIGLIILAGLKFNGNDKWEGGDIYDPESGKTYSSYLCLNDNNTLKITGYVGISLFGRTEIWTRTN